LIRSIWAIFFAEILTTNLIQLLDPVGHLQRNFLAPRAATQDAMNLNMQGQVIELAERYTVSGVMTSSLLQYMSVTGVAYFCRVFSPLVEHDQAFVLGTMVLLHLSLHTVPMLLCTACQLLYGSLQSYAHLETCTNAWQYH